jgi:hypothetical protein
MCTPWFSSKDGVQDKPPKRALPAEGTPEE